ncbi:uncharacterized protein STEHIDRAFT_153750 [Stereum hirsutum FP-91666 SS1]|uniref:uncharacterized protein n=1 Tax=Stereum hirsutum (strain FP-91666) TaxID=721885 RepID=UPI000440EFCD|nr:uncharacterized protein STEHIDRAFT_153750 [Stereum hirsutum FP-91666 SS1]EIM89913.1 hypothetical protein STEHIDRAFT_153750 [Stereum hirsutum FP-91666 SS1]
MSSTLTTLVPVFDGTNLPSWAPKMLACLCSVGLGYVLRVARPSEAAADPATATPSATTGTGTQAGGSAAGGTQAGETTTSSSNAASSSAAALEWDKDDEKAMGMIRLCVTKSIGQMLDTKSTAKEMWNALEAQYGRKGLGGAGVHVRPL